MADSEARILNSITILQDALDQARAGQQINLGKPKLVVHMEGGTQDLTMREAQVGLILMRADLAARRTAGKAP